MLFQRVKLLERICLCLNLVVFFVASVETAFAKETKKNMNEEFNAREVIN